MSGHWEARTERGDETSQGTITLHQYLTRRSFSQGSHVSCGRFLRCFTCTCTLPLAALSPLQLHTLSYVLILRWRWGRRGGPTSAPTTSRHSPRISVCPIYVRLHRLGLQRLRYLFAGGGHHDQQEEPRASSQTEASPHRPRRVRTEAEDSQSCRCPAHHRTRENQT